MSISVSAIQTAYTAYVAGLSTYNSAVSTVQADAATLAAVEFPVDVTADADYNTPLAAFNTALTNLQTAQAALVTAHAALPALQSAVIAIMPPNQWVKMATQSQYIGFVPQPSPAQERLVVISSAPTQDFPLF